MKLLFSLAAILLVAAPVHAACTYPTAPAKIPDGATATLAEMVAAQKAVKQFDEQINAYTACIKLEEDAQLKGDKLTAEQKKAIEAQQAQKNNAAVDEDQALADRFNEQIRIFKAKSGTPKG
ncbi:MAG TPA: hypothetical protein VK820_00945 [Steroidobacteraceae bacterium]|nr:hypothetical protein [Steroidobacteraceae bacterium]